MKQYLSEALCPFIHCAPFEPRAGPMKRVALNYNEYDVRGNGTYEECIEESLQTPC